MVAAKDIILRFPTVFVLWVKVKARLLGIYSQLELAIYFEMLQGRRHR